MKSELVTYSGVPKTCACNVRAGTYSKRISHTPGTRRASRKDFDPKRMASQVHINSLNLGLNFKPWFENFKPGFENFKPGFKTQSAH